MAATTTCGERLVELLEGYGVETVFGIPGVHTVELYRGLPATGIRHVTPRHEQGAGFMADGYARASGRPGVCFVISGPGVTNIATAMGQAYADSVPLLVISSVIHSAHLGRGEGRLHELPDQRALTAGITAFSETVRDPAALPDALARAFAVFRGRRPRPVHLEIPIDVITRDASAVPRRIAAPPARPAPAPAAVERAADLLRDARRPVLLLGGGAVAAGALAATLAERLDAPTTLTINAKGLLPASHPLNLGSNQSLTAVRQLVREADVVLAVGTELGETDYDVVFDGGFTIDGTLIRVDIDPDMLDANHPASLGMHADATLAVEALLAALDHGALAREAAGADRTRAARAALAGELPTAWAGHRRVFETVRAALDDPIFVGDSTQPVYSGNHLVDTDRPRRWFNSTTGYGTLGYALPASVGARLAGPARPVVCLVGDGGLQFTFSELAAAVEAGAPVIVLLWNNDGYGEIKRYMRGRGLPEIGVDLYTPDLLAAVAAFGCETAAVDNLAALEAAVRDAATAQRPTVIEIREDAPFLASD
ncbi:5-guanidino-2-oxopentanoate decarboxylase [Arhodomonas sp. AD133]|uniref:5-guanidino-2-oxopentanoate decarboxylase n=1 Tax=Arhodomonas sp. AD133 TaxID=3415009 RepID=UPI003EBB2BF4